MKTQNAIATYEKLESIRDNEGGTFTPKLTDSQITQFCRVGLALLKHAKSKPENGYPVQWRNRFYPENLSLES